MRFGITGILVAFLLLVVVMPAMPFITSILERCFRDSSCFFSSILGSCAETSQLQFEVWNLLNKIAKSSLEVELQASLEPEMGRNWCLWCVDFAKPRDTTCF